MNVAFMTVVERIIWHLNPADQVKIYFYINIILCE